MLNTFNMFHHNIKVVHSGESNTKRNNFSHNPIHFHTRNQLLCETEIHLQVSRQVYFSNITASNFGVKFIVHLLGNIF